MEEVRTGAVLGELRQVGNTLTGTFPYNAVATVAATGRRRKETFRPGSFRFALNDPERDVFVLAGHDLNQPLGSKLAGNVRFQDGEDALRFTVDLPVESERPQYMRGRVAEHRERHDARDQSPVRRAAQGTSSGRRNIRGRRWQPGCGHSGPLGCCAEGVQRRHRSGLSGVEHGDPEQAADMVVVVLMKWADVLDFLIGPADAPESTETRSNGYTDLVLDAQFRAAEGATPSGAIAVAEIASGLVSRAFSSAEVSPVSNRTAGLGPATLGQIGRALIARGEWLAEVAVEDGAIVLVPACSWNMTGGPMPSTWQYTAEFAAPSGVVQKPLTPDRVVHVRVNADELRPWEGRSPLARSGATREVLVYMERALTRELKLPVGRIMPLPRDYVVEGLQESVKGLAGNVIMAESTSTGGADGDIQGAPQSDWKAQKLGPEPHEALQGLRVDVSDDLLSACGIPPALVRPRDAASARASWEHFAWSTVRPLANVVEAECQVKLGEPDLHLDFTRLQAGGVQGRARAAASLATAGASVEDALEQTGFEVE